MGTIDHEREAAYARERHAHMRHAHMRQAHQQRAYQRHTHPCLEHRPC